MTQSSEIIRFFESRPNISAWAAAGYFFDPDSMTLSAEATFVPNTSDHYTADLTLTWDPNATVYYDPPITPTTRSPGRRATNQGGGEA